MGADVSRVRFDPRLNYSGVVHQQGRVVLDADGNEQQAMTDRRQRAAAADLGSPGPSLGVRGTAVVPRTTPDGFRPTVTGGVLTIGRGRMYVDGLLAENHGTGAVEFDVLLAGPTGGADTPYLGQPYWPYRAAPADRRHPPGLPRRLGARADVRRGIGPRRPGRRGGHHGPHSGRVAGACARPGRAGAHLRDSGCGHPGVARSDRPLGRAADRRHGRGRRPAEPVQPAAEWRLPRAGEPDVPGRDPPGRRPRHRHLQVVAGERLDHAPRHRTRLGQPAPPCVAGQGRRRARPQGRPVGGDPGRPSRVRPATRRDPPDRAPPGGPLDLVQPRAAARVAGQHRRGAGATPEGPALGPVRDREEQHERHGDRPGRARFDRRDRGPHRRHRRRPRERCDGGPHLTRR